MNRYLLSLLLSVALAAGCQAQWEPYTMTNSPLLTNNISSLEISPDGRVLIGSHGRGLYVKNFNHWTILRQNNTGVPINYTRVMAYAPDTFFVGSASGDLDAQPIGEGVSYLNLTDSSWAQANLGLEISQVITGVEVTPDYRAVSCYGGGVTIYDDMGWIRYQADFRTVFTYADSQQQVFKVSPGTYLNSDYIRGTDYDPRNGVLWLATLEGAVRYMNGTWEIFNIGNSGLPSNSIQVVKVDTGGAPDGAVYFGTSGFGLAKKTGDSWTVMNSGNSPLVSDFVYAIEIRPDNGDLWVGSAMGLNSVSAQGFWRSYVPPDSNLVSGDFFSDIAFDSIGNVWVSTFGGGIASKRLATEPEPEDSLFVEVIRLKFLIRHPDRNDVTMLRALLMPEVALADTDSVSITIASQAERVYSWENTFAVFDHTFHNPNRDRYEASVAGGNVDLTYVHRRGLIKLNLRDDEQVVNLDSASTVLDVRVRLGSFIGHDFVWIGPVDPVADGDADLLGYDGEGFLLAATDIPVATGIEDQPDGPAEILTAPVSHPNPFNAATALNLELGVAAEVGLTVYDVLGRTVTSSRTVLEAGSHRLTWDGTARASGTYFYVLDIAGRSYAGRMVLVK